jgi:pimeloyl-ACP methyl ester carboxylesterase
VHGSIIADAFVPLLRQPTLAGSYRLVSYHRRGFAGSTHPDRPFSIAEQAADCRVLLRTLGIDRAHVVGHSYGGVIALQLALDAPEMVHSLALLEPPLLAVPSGPLLMEAMGLLAALYQAGDKAGAVDAFQRSVMGPEYRVTLDAAVPGGFDQAVADADTFFAQELPALAEWRFTREDARGIAQPSPGCAWSRQREPMARLQRRVRTCARVAPSGRGIRLGRCDARLADAESARCRGGLGGVLRTAPTVTVTTSCEDFGGGRR